MFFLTRGSAVMKFWESLPRLGTADRLFRGDRERPPASTVRTRRWSAPVIASREM
jgi:hypothetical protein